MLRLLLWALAAVAVLALGYTGYAAAVGKKQALAQLLGAVRREPVDFSTLRLKPSPNQFLVCPPGYCAAEAHLASPEFDMSAAELRNRWVERIETLPRVERIAGDDASEQYDFEQTTPLLGFPDTITVRFIDLGDGRSTFAVYSRSHYGYSDMGANRKRIGQWLANLEAGL